VASRKFVSDRKGVQRCDGSGPITSRVIINRVPLFVISVKSLTVNYSDTRVTRAFGPRDAVINYISRAVIVHNTSFSEGILFE